MKLEVDIRKRVGELTIDFKTVFNKNRYGIYGSSGSGKSTLLGIIAGLITPEEGRIRLNDQWLFDSDRCVNLNPEKRRIGVVFQHAHLFPHLSVKKNLLYGFCRTKREERKINPDRIIELLGLQPLIHRSIKKLSGGERQRVALGRTILASPKLMLLDEPLSGLDTVAKKQIIEQLITLLEEVKIPFLLVSHSFEEIQLMTSEVLLMDNGTNLCQIQSDRLTPETSNKIFQKSAHSPHHHPEHHTNSQEKVRVQQTFSLFTSTPCKAVQSSV